MKSKINKPPTKKYVWKLFSEYIRLKDADKNGYCQCWSCSRKLKWNDGIDAGHYIAKGTGAKGLALEFHEKNVHPQCKWCNRNKGYNKAHLEQIKQRYTVSMIKAYGEGVFDELELAKHQIKVIDLRKLADKLKQQINKQKERLGVGW